jgi:CheY-like chemotaxis protein
MGARDGAFNVLMADDDSDDRFMIERALRLEGLADDFHGVVDGDEVLDYLHRKGRYAARRGPARPSVLLLDLNMPRKNGFETLAEIRNDPALRTLPVLVLSTSGSVDDVDASYRLGAKSFLRKPTTYDGLVKLLAAVRRYWGDTAAATEHP